MGNSNERTAMQTFKKDYEKRALDENDRYGRTKYYSKRSNPSEIIMVKDYWTNNLDESTSYDEMVNTRKELNHENLARCYVHDVYQENQFFTKFYKHSTAHEYHSQNLYKRISQHNKERGRRGFSESEVWYLSYSMVDLDNTLMNDSLGTPHGDLQPKNIMYSEEGNIKILDNAIVTNKDAYQKCNFNPSYFAPLSPELLTDLRRNKVNPDNYYSDKSEIWAIGITSLCASTGNYPEDYYNWRSKTYLREKVAEDLENLQGQRSPEQIMFIRKCLEEDPNQRWTVGEASEYFRPYREDARHRRLNFMNREVRKTSELGGNDFFDNEALGYTEVVKETGVREVHDERPVRHVRQEHTDELDGNDFFDNEGLKHQDVVYEEGVRQEGHYEARDSNTNFF